VAPPLQLIFGVLLHLCCVPSVFLQLFLFFFTFCFSVFLLILCSLVYRLPPLIWSNLLVETFITGVYSSSMVPVRFLTVLSLQLLNGGCCLYRLELLTEPFFLVYRFVWPLERLGSVLDPLPTVCSHICITFSVWVLMLGTREPTPFRLCFSM